MMRKETGSVLPALEEERRLLVVDLSDGILPSQPARHVADDLQTSRLQHRLDRGAEGCEMPRMDHGCVDGCKGLEDGCWCVAPVGLDVKHLDEEAFLVVHPLKQVLDVVAGCRLDRQALRLLAELLQVVLRHSSEVAVSGGQVRSQDAGCHVRVGRCLACDLGPPPVLVVDDAEELLDIWYQGVCVLDHLLESAVCQRVSS
jgi:hypothetical protein